MNLAYLESADMRYFSDKKAHAESPEILLKNGYIDYVPQDYQRIDKKTGIIYFYNPDTTHWDSKMGEY